MKNTFTLAASLVSSLIKSRSSDAVMMIRELLYYKLMI